MKLKDFKITKQVITAAKKKGTYSFCECCLSTNPELDDGYTTCCNEPSIDKDTALMNAKTTDIQNFLSTKWKTRSFLSNNSSRKANLITFVLENKNKSFDIYVDISEEDIIKNVLEATKGLKKDK